MDNKIQPTNNPQVGNILIINTGSTTTKLGYYSDGVRVFDTKLEHTAEDVAKYPSVMDQSDMRHQAIRDLSNDELLLIKYRFYEGKTQCESAKLLGISQVQVSRREKQLLAKLRTRLE